MTTQVSVESISLTVHQNVPVITTELLARLYESEEKHIRQNFKRNEDRFITGKHYFKVTGSELNDLRTSQRGLQISPKTRSLILWTERGAARHAKMLETDQAWEVFEKLEDCYFSQKKITEPLPAAYDNGRLLDLAMIAWSAHRDMDVVLDCFNQRKPGWDSEVFWRLMTIRSDVTELGWGMIKLAGFPK